MLLEREDLHMQKWRNNKMISAKCVVCLLINRHLLSVLGTRPWARQGRYRDQRDPAYSLSPGVSGKDRLLNRSGPL